MSREGSIAMQRRIFAAAGAQLREAWQLGFNAGPDRWAPDKPGTYERLTALGVRRDYFDGRVWTRTSIRVNRVACANQELPWREAGCV